MNKKIVTLGFMSLWLLLLAGCNKPVPTQEDTNKPLWKISADCVSYFDGCNTCTISGWMVWWCTKMYCAPENIQEPKCLEMTWLPTEPVLDQTMLADFDTTWEKIDLNSCKSYFDGCNKCSVENWEVKACTEMYCENYQKPKCLDGMDESWDKDNDKINDCEKEWVCDDSVDYTVSKPEAK